MVHFREATAEDAGLISHIYASSWRKSYRDLISADYLERLPDEYWVPSMRSWLGSGRLEALMIYEDKQPIGCACYGRGRDEDHGDWGEIVSIYLLPEWMGKGYGKQLFEETMRRLQTQGFTRFYLWMIRGNDRAAGFYTRHGFKVTGDTVEYHIGGQAITDVRYVRVDK